MSPITLSQKYEKLYGANVFGKSEGEIKVFKDSGKAKAYMWKSDGQTWEEIGEVIDPS